LLSYNIFSDSLRYSQRLKLTSKVLDEYNQVKQLPNAVIRQQAAPQQQHQAKLLPQTAVESGGSSTSTVVAGGVAPGSNVQAMLDSMPAVQQQ
jgi:hypothetical protein